MATFTFHKGRHRALPLYWLRWWPFVWNPTRFSRKVKFLFETKYRLDNGDQDDINKLFGIGLFRPHHYSSRFGWRYSPEINKFVLYAYTYQNGQRSWTSLCECVANHWYECELLIFPHKHVFRVIDEKCNEVASFYVSAHPASKIGLLLGAYFGGNRPAPETLKLELKK